MANPETIINGRFKSCLPGLFKDTLKAVEKFVFFNNFRRAYSVPGDVAHRMQDLADALSCQLPELKPKKTHLTYPIKILYLAAEEDHIFDPELLVELRRATALSACDGKNCALDKQLMGLTITPQVTYAACERKRELEKIIWSEENIKRFGRWLEDLSPSEN